MDHYIYLIFIVLLLLGLSNFNNKIFILLFLIISFFAGFRYFIGIDYENYTLLYEWTNEGSNPTSEPLFSYYNRFCYYLGGNAQLFFLMSSIITNFFVFLAIKKLSTNYILSFLIYFCVISFYLYTFNATRQWLACSIFLYSLYFFKEKKYLIYIIINTIAALTFHTSLFIIFPLTFITTLTLNKYVKLMGVLLAFVIGFLTDFFLKNSLYDKYQEVDFDSVIDFKVYLFLIISIIVEFSRNKIIEKGNKWSLILLNINFLSILLLLILIMQNSGTMILLFKRIHNYYFAVYILMIPFIISKFKNVKGGQELINLSFYILLPILFLITIYFNGDVNKLTPYNYNFNVFR